MNQELINSLPLENYWIYKDFILNDEFEIDVRTINRKNYELHYKSVFNIILDTVETEYCRARKITLKFGDEPDMKCRMCIQDYWVNLIMWYMIVYTHRIIKPKHIFFDDAVTQSTIKNYIDKYLIDEFRVKLDYIIINTTIDNCMYRYFDIDDLSDYLANTINIEDPIELMKENKRFFELLHSDISNIPLAQVNKVTTERCNESIEIIKQHPMNCFYPFFESKEGIKPKQYREVFINTGTRANGKQGVYPSAIKNSFITGGTNTLDAFQFECSNGRLAQIIIAKNVGDSGSFARYLGLNNTDTFINPDPHYVCNSKNFIHITIKDKKMLEQFENRYYRLKENGMEYKITNNDTQLIGQEILLRSPMTCASAAAGHGICYRCYGDLAYFIKDINAGKISAELVSSELTQRMLSAKHLLETDIIDLVWSEGFLELFGLDFNLIKVADKFSPEDLVGYSLIIDVSSIKLLEGNTDDIEYNEYINYFKIKDPAGNIHMMRTEKNNPLFLTLDINKYIRSVTDDVTKYKTIEIPLSKIKEDDIYLFAVELSNNDLSLALKRVTNTINSKKVTEKLTKDQILAQLLENFKDGGLHVSAVHAEVLLMNQIRSKDEPLEKPDWSIPNVEYSVKSLSSALMENPSIIVSLAYGKIKSALNNPLTYKKRKPSKFDLYYLEKPQNFTDSKYMTKDEKKPEYDENGKIVVMKKSIRDKDK